MRGTMAIIAALIFANTATAQEEAKPPVGHPMGSVTYFLILSQGEEDKTETRIIPATSTRKIRSVESLLRRIQEEDELGGTPATEVQHFTVTVWSDSRVEQTQPMPTTLETTRMLIERLEEEAGIDNELTLAKKPKSSSSTKKDKPSYAVPAGSPTAPASAHQTGKYAAGDQCHAKTDKGDRCSRTARGTSGFCFQHQQHADAFPTK